MKAKELKKSYFDWLFQKYSYHDLSDGIVKINTPFLDNQFDYITMYVEFFSDGKINLTDDGWTLHDLKSNGVYFTPRHKTNNQLLRNITDSLGVEINDNELSIKTDIDKFPIAKQRLLQCIMQVNDLIVLKSNNIRGLFFEEVEKLLKSNNVLFSSKPSFAGKGGITVQFDFSIPTSNKEKLIRTIRNGNDLNRSKLMTVDAQLLRNTKPNAEYIAIFDDINNPLKNIAEINTLFSEDNGLQIQSLTMSKAKENPSLLLNKKIS